MLNLCEKVTGRKQIPRGNAPVMPFCPDQECIFGAEPPGKIRNPGCLRRLRTTAGHSKGSNVVLENFLQNKNEGRYSTIIVKRSRVMIHDHSFMGNKGLLVGEITVETVRQKADIHVCAQKIPGCCFSSTSSHGTALQGSKNRETF